MPLADFERRKHRRPAFFIGGQSVIEYNSLAPRLLIFDLDGTLLDTAPDIINAINDLMLERNRPPLPNSQIIAAIGEGLKSTVFKLFPECHGDSVALQTLESDFLRHYENNLTQLTQPFPGGIDFLDGLSPQTQIAIVTNKYERLAKKLITSGPLSRFPWLVIFGADSLAAQKPDPLPLREAMRIAGTTQAQTVMIGDGTPDMRAARAAGVRSIACEFGYTALSVLLAAGANVTLASYDRLPKVLRDLGFNDAANDAANGAD